MDIEMKPVTKRSSAVILYSDDHTLHTKVVHAFANLLQNVCLNSQILLDVCKKRDVLLERALEFADIVIIIISEGAVVKAKCYDERCDLPTFCDALSNDFVEGYRYIRRRGIGRTFAKPKKQPHIIQIKFDYTRECSLPFLDVFSKYQLPQELQSLLLDVAHLCTATPNQTIAPPIQLNKRSAADTGQHYQEIPQFFTALNAMKLMAAKSPHWFKDMYGEVKSQNGYCQQEDHVHVHVHAAEQGNSIGWPAEPLNDSEDPSLVGSELNRDYDRIPVVIDTTTDTMTDNSSRGISFPIQYNTTGDQDREGVAEAQLLLEDTYSTDVCVGD